MLALSVVGASGLPRKQLEGRLARDGGAGLMRRLSAAPEGLELSYQELSAQRVPKPYMQLVVNRLSVMKTAG